MRYYFVDYENVGGCSLCGIDYLNSDDVVNILYSGHNEMISLALLNELLVSNANIHFIKVATGTNNALDFQLVMMLFINATVDDQYYIISKDKGYDVCINLATNVYNLKVLRASTIQETLSPSLDLCNLIRNCIQDIVPVQKVEGVTKFLYQIISNNLDDYERVVFGMKHSIDVTYRQEVVEAITTHWVELKQCEL